VPPEGAAPKGDGGAYDAQPVDRGLEALSWSSIPALDSSTYREFSSYDRDEASTFPFVKPGNKDFNTWLAVCGNRPAIGYGSIVGALTCDPELEGYLVASDDAGPGYVTRIFYTHADFDSNAPRDKEKIRIFVDDLSTPVYEGTIADWGKEAEAPFTEPLAGRTSGAIVSYVPISYSSKLRVLLDDLSPTAVYYYQVGVKSSGATLPFTPGRLDGAAVVAHLKDERARSDDRTVWEDGSSELSAGATKRVLDRDGPGTIESLSLTVKSATPSALGAIVLGVSWDDATDHAVELPLAAIFGQGLELADFETLPMSVRTTGTDTTMTLSLPMPFSTHARVEVVNTDTAARTIGARIEGVPRLLPHAGRLHADAQERRAPMAAGSRFPVATLSGGGRYVGSVVTLQGTGDMTLPASSPYNFLEGDAVLEVDGKLAGHGTGTEDFFDGGWYFENGTFASPFAAMISMAAAPSQTAGRVTAARWQFMTGAVDFRDSLSLSLEYGTNLPSIALRYSSVAFSYQAR
jgi:hypothetical protein